VKKLLLFVLLVGAAVAGLALWAYYPRRYILTEQKVQFVRLQYGTVRDVVSATGRLEPRETRAVTCQIPGVVVALHGKINDLVEDGAVLALLDKVNAQRDLDEARNGVEAADAQVLQAEAVKKSAKVELDYQIDVAKGGFRSEREQTEAKLAAAEAGIKAAKARFEASTIALQKAKETLARTEIRVPGQCCTETAAKVPHRFLILDRQVQLGQFVTPQGPPLFTLARDLEYMDLHVNVAEGDVGRIRPGQSVRFSVQAFTDEEVPFTGTITEIRPLGVSTKGAVFFTTVIAVERNKKDPQSKEWRLRPGMTTSVDIIRREHKDVWKIPTEALNFQLDKAYWSEAARRRIADWQQQRKDAADWQTVWTWGADPAGPWPMFLRLSGVRADGNAGIKDSDFVEILEFEPGVSFEPQNPPRIIIEAPPAHAPGFFDQPMNIKVS